MTNRKKSDVREALVALIPPPRAPEHVDHWPQDEQDYYRHGDFSDWAERLEVLDRMRREKVADAILDEFDVAPRGEDQWWESLVEAPCDQGHRVFIDDGDGGVYACPACKFDATERGEVVVERDDSCSYCGRVHSDFAACGEDTTVTPTVHDHEWRRRQNVTSRGYRMPPYEVCVVDGCGAARQVDEPATCDHGGTLTRRFDGGRGAMTCDLCDEIVGYWTPPSERVKPTVEDVARAILMVTQAADVDPDYAWNVQYPEVQDELLDQARAVLALLPGRTETEVKAEAWDEGFVAGVNTDMGDHEHPPEEYANPYRQGANRG